MNLFPIQSRRCLVIETDGFSVRGAVLRRRGKEISAERWAESQAADRELAVAEVLDQLGPSLPRQAIVLTADVVAATVELPVSPKQRRPWAQMQQMLRWEMEPYLAQHAVARPLSEILACRGYLTDEQIEQVQQELEHRKGMPTSRSRSGTLSGDPFGDLAVELGLVSSERLNECQRLQEEQQLAEDDELICGWSPQPSGDAAAGSYPWLVCATTQSRRDEWNQRLAHRGIRLSGLYPLAPSSAGVAQTEATSGGVILDVYRGWIGVTKLRGSSIESVQLHPLSSSTPSVELCQELIGRRNGDAVWLAGSHPDVARLADGLRERTGGAAELLAGAAPRRSADDSPPVSAAALGAARDRLGLSPRHLVTSVAAYDPAPPVARRPVTWAAAAVLLVAGVIAAAELSLAARRQVAQHEYDTARQNLDEIESAVAAIEQKAERAEQLKTQLAGLREEGSGLARHNRFWRQAVPARAACVTETFDAIAGAVSGSVALDRVEEKPDGQIEIELWALRDVPAHEFARNLSVQLSKHYAVSVQQGGQRSGRLKLPGYGLTLHLAHEPSGDPAAPETPVAMRPPSAQPHRGVAQK